MAQRADNGWEMPPGPLRWDPIPVPAEDLTFITGVRTITSGGDVSGKTGAANHVYLITRSMRDEYFFNGDGEMLFVLQQSNLRFWTEFGIIDAEPGEIVVIPRGIKFRVELVTARPAAISAKTTAAPSRCPNADRSARTAWPTPGTS